METKQGYPGELVTALRLGNPSLRLVKLGYDVIAGTFLNTYLG